MADSVVYPWKGPLPFLGRGWIQLPPIDFHTTTLAIREPFNPIAYEPALLVLYQNGIGPLRGFPALEPPLVMVNGNAWRAATVVLIVPRLHTRTA